MGGNPGRPTIQRLQPRTQRGGQIAQFIRRHPMLARQRPDGKKPFFQRLKLGRIEIQRRQTSFHALLRFAQFDQRPVQRGHRPRQTALGPLCRAIHPAQRIPHRPFGPLIGQGLCRTGHIRADPLGPLHQTAPRIQHRFLARFGVQPVQFGHGMAQEFLFLARRLQRGLCRRQIGPRHRLRTPRRPQRRQIQSRKGIQQGPMPPRVQQTAIIMLPMQFHQRLGQVAQHIARDAVVIDPGRLAPIQRVDPPQDQFTLVQPKPRLIQNRPGRMVGGQVEHRRHAALRRALTHQFGPSAPAQHETQRIQQDRLSRPGFARQHVQPRPEFKFQPVNDQHIPDFQCPQHAQVPAGRALARHIHSPLTIWR